ncbi:MAG: OB-fold domain-containing protein [Chloroflexi bacterium]|nr:OB-fold domain-containing protein [Chloroflexota bacterium]MBU1746697.1 OB-fold domain-containing protein [Chloroflexota bacterium]MBU1877758.1 OB-fold domain-containing protein [Chloroflexota bacterium]
MSEITAYKCQACGYVMYPSHYRCLHCGNREFDEIAPSERGKLLTYTEIWNLPWGIDERSRVIGVVEFDNGVKAMGLLKTDAPKLGMKLAAGWEPVRVIGGEEVYGLVFAPVK